MSRRVWGTVVCGVACAVGAGAFRAEDSPETRAVKEQLARQAARIESLDVSYKLETSSDLKPSELTALSAFRNQLFLPKDEWREAFKGKKRYVRQIQPERIEWLTPPDAYGLAPPREPDASAPKAIRENWEQMKKQYDTAVANIKLMEARGIHTQRRDPNVRDLIQRDDTRAYNGHTLWRRRPVSAKVDTYMVWPAGKTAHWFSLSAYQAAVGLQSLDPTPGGKEDAKALELFRIDDWVKGRDYAVEGQTEVVDGSTCVVLKGVIHPRSQAPSAVGDISDRIWLDRDHGFVVRKREMTMGGKLTNRWTTLDLKEVEPGLWLPYRTQHEQFAADAPPASQGKPVVIEETRVQKLEVNHVPDDLFDMVPRKGDQVEDLRGNF